MTTAVRPEVITLWPEGAPGSEDWAPLPDGKLELDTPLLGTSRIVRNVVVPTLTPILPEPSVANGTGVIVCPGGGFQFLMVDKEGLDVARWLNERGIAAFMLKYRLAQMPLDDDQFVAEVRARQNDPAVREKFRQQTAPIRPLAVDDGRQAMRIVRQRGDEWGLNQDRIGIIGFSAGGLVTCGVALHFDAETRPSFAAPIYGAPRDPVTSPADAPPLFIAVADNDDSASRASVALYSAWKEGGHSAELHIYSKGGHGFGMKQQGLPSDSWIDRFGEWLEVQGFVS
jgi:acetyl esterase/lipase